MNHQDDDKNIISFASAKRRKRKGATKGFGSNGKGQIWSKVQFVLFLLVIAYLMHLCGGS